jgi:Ca-activated chloride channel family protein
MTLRPSRAFAVALAHAASAAGAAPEGDAESARWLAQVEPLLTAAEREAYEALPRAYQRRAFERRFWQVRDPFPETAVNEFAERWRERAPTALERWGTLEDARAVAWLAAGEPQSTLVVRCAELLRPVEIWSFGPAGRMRAGFVAVFHAESYGAGARFAGWSPRGGPSALAAAGGSALAAEGELLARVARDCPRGGEIASLLLVAADWDEVVERGGLLPQPNPEWVRTFSALSTDLPADAEPLPASLDVRFGDGVGLRTAVEGVVRLAAPPDAERTLQLDGEVLRGDELFEQFRYRFRLAPGESAPLLFERRLRPGDYRLVVRLHDAASDRWFRDERALQVPLAGDAVAAVRAIDDAPAAAAAPAAEGEAASVRVLLPSERLMTGKVRFETAVRGDAIAAVAFTLDGRSVLTKRRPPFTVELDLGRDPRLHRVGAVALAADGRELARDEALVNGGPHRFAVRLVEPQSIPAGAERVHARAEIDLPEGDALDRVEFYVNDSLHATLFQPPFRQSLPLPRGAELAWVRVVAHLAVGGAAVDVRLVGGGERATGVDVDFVELYATALDRRGRPVEDLRAEEVAVREGGRPQEIRRFERVADLPMHAAVLLDTSSSMAEELEEAERAALRFFTDVLTDRDRAAVITFADEPRLAVRFARDLEVLAGGLADLEASGDTRLWDAVAFALHYFSGIRAKRALVLISDGLDSGSRFGYEQILEYARRTGVAIYVVGLNVPNRPPEPGMFLDRLARETGGRSFRIAQAVELGPVYREIERELRAQYLIAYQSSSPPSDEFREIALDATRGGVELRTVRGYYP